MATPIVRLLTSHSIPMLGLGTWNSPKGEVKQAVEVAIDAGYRHIDCAFIYGNEDEIGEGIQAKIREGKVKREDLFITSKLWGTFHHPKDVKSSLQATLKSLQTDYVDLYLIHSPLGFVNNGELYPRDQKGNFIYSDDDYVDTWKVMEEVHKEGFARSIGVSNFNEYQINRIISECTVVPANNQIESHPYLTNDTLVKYCKSKGITVTAYAPFGSPTRPWAKGDDPKPLEDPKIIAIADRLGKTPAQVVLRYQIQRGVITIPKSVTPARIRSNIEIFDFDLTGEDMRIIGGFNRNFRACNIHLATDHKYWPFRPNYTESANKL